MDNKKAATAGGDGLRPESVRSENQLNQLIAKIDLLNKNLSCVVAHLDSFVSLRQAEYSAATRAGLASRGHHQEDRNLDYARTGRVGPVGHGNL